MQMYCPQVRKQPRSSAQQAPRHARGTNRYEFRQRGRGRDRIKEDDIAADRCKIRGRSAAIFKLIMTLAKLYNNPAELAGMNHKKKGRPFTYTASLIAAIVEIRNQLHLSLRGCEGMCETSMDDNAPDYSTLCRRINKLDASIKDSLSDIECEDMAVHLVPDGTGMTPTTRSEYVRVVHHLKRGFLRMTIMINKETLEIVSAKITKDDVGESVVFDDLLNDALENLGINAAERRAKVLQERNCNNKTYRTVTLMADGGYDNRAIFSACKKLDIKTSIRVRKDANARAGGVDRARSEAVLDQLAGSPDASPAELASLNEAEREKNRKEWKKRVECGTRWLVEIVISAFKRTYGDAVTCKSLANIRQEIKLKICTYNRMLQVGREAAMKA